MEHYDFIVLYESGKATKQQVIAGFQKMIDDQFVWGLQSFYGDKAKFLIETGRCTCSNLPEELKEVVTVP
jgi:hypothetical protein